MNISKKKKAPQAILVVEHRNIKKVMTDHESAPSPRHSWMNRLCAPYSLSTHSGEVILQDIRCTREDLDKTSK